MQQFIKHRWLILLPVFLVAVGFVRVASEYTGDRQNPQTSPITEESYVVGSGDVVYENVDRQAVPEPSRVPVPQEVRGLYWTAVTAGSSSGQTLLAYMKSSGINTVVIDLKMDNGELAFMPNDQSLVQYAQQRPAISDLDGLLARLAEEGIYRIARIPVMRDGAFALLHPELAMHAQEGGLWRDNIGSLWLDPAASQVAEYAIALAKEAYARGFDEVQFDYIRFASDGAVSRIVYPLSDGMESKVSVMQQFFKRIGEAMRAEGIPASYDLFGMTFWSYNDFNIGQRLVDILPYADWVSPMVYPSHYPDGFEGFANPAEAPYEIVYRSLEKGTMLTRGFWSGSEEGLRSKWRPWLQDFDIGAVYTSDLIEAQIKAARDAGASGWILWNARNVYEPANYQ